MRIVKKNAEIYSQVLGLLRFLVAVAAITLSVFILKAFSAGVIP